jgi:hypothetical protein
LAEAAGPESDGSAFLMPLGVLFSDASSAQASSVLASSRILTIGGVSANDPCNGTAIEAINSSTPVAFSQLSPTKSLTKVTGFGIRDLPEQLNGQSLPRLCKPRASDSPENRGGDKAF